jgi:hypothetical protein
MSGVHACISGEGLVSYRPSVTGGGAAFKARGCPPIFCENRFPPRPLARRFAMLRGPDSSTSARLLEAVLDIGNRFEECVMATISSISESTDRVMARLIAGLQIEFGCRAAEGLAHHFLEAEEVDFHWDARISERWLGAYQAQDDDELELDRVSIMGRLDGRWFIATCIVDGDGNAHGMLGCRDFRSESVARKAYSDA